MNKARSITMSSRTDPGLGVANKGRTFPQGTRSARNYYVKSETRCILCKLDSENHPAHLVLHRRAPHPGGWQTLLFHVQEARWFCDPRLRVEGYVYRHYPNQTVVRIAPRPAWAATDHAHGWSLGTRIVMSRFWNVELIGPPIGWEDVRMRDLRSRFWSKVDKSGDCWEWRGYRIPEGYGMFYAGGSHGNAPVYAHRVAWELAHGRPVPPRGRICHSCDNPACVKPTHLFLGSQADNLNDMRAKGRARKTGARLDSKKAAQIRNSYKRGGTTQAALAREYGVTRATISRLLNGKSWPVIDLQRLA